MSVHIEQRCCTGLVCSWIRKGVWPLWHVHPNAAKYLIYVHLIKNWNQPLTSWRTENQTSVFNQMFVSSWAKNSQCRGFACMFVKAFWSVHIPVVMLDTTPDLLQVKYLVVKQNLIVGTIPSVWNTMTQVSMLVHTVACILAGQAMLCFMQNAESGRTYAELHSHTSFLRMCAQLCWFCINATVSAGWQLCSWHGQLYRGRNWFYAFISRCLLCCTCCSRSNAEVDHAGFYCLFWMVLSYHSLVLVLQLAEVDLSSNALSGTLPSSWSQLSQVSMPFALGHAICIRAWGHHISQVTSWW